MNPQQPYQTPTPPGSSYDFFLNPQKPPKRSSFSGILSGPSSTAIKLGMVACAVFLVLIILYFVLSLFSSGNQTQLLVVAQDQNELIRVANLATTIGQSQSQQTTQNLAQSVALSLTTEQQQLLTFMASEGGKPSSKELSATKDTATDAELNNSIESSSFDVTFIGIMQSQLKSYQAALQSAFTSTNNLNEKLLLSNDYKAAGLLLTQINSPTQ